MPLLILLILLLLVSWSKVLTYAVLLGFGAYYLIRFCGRACVAKEQKGLNRMFHGECRHCGYDKRGNPDGRCSECGELW
jgi:hypothetical protein